MYTEESFNWFEIMKDFQEYNSVRFAQWVIANYPRTNVVNGEWTFDRSLPPHPHNWETMEQIFQNWKKESRDEPGYHRESSLEVPFKDSEQDIPDQDA